MIPKHKHKLNSNIVGIPVMKEFKYRGKFNRMWRCKSVTIKDIVYNLYKHYNK